MLTTKLYIVEYDQISRGSYMFVKWLDVDDGLSKCSDVHCDIEDGGSVAESYLELD